DEAKATSGRAFPHFAVLDAVYRFRISYVRPFQPGIGSTGVPAATDARRPTAGMRLRFCTAADGTFGFWPFSSNLIGGPIMTCSAISVARIAFISSGPAGVP